jgi:hypothetical protein
VESQQSKVSVRLEAPVARKLESLLKEDPGLAEAISGNVACEPVRRDPTASPPAR